MNNLYLCTAFEQYNLQNKSATLLGHNENMAFSVADLFLLRIHKSTEIFNADFLYTDLDRKDVYSAEMQFLIHLKKHKLNVQTPIADKNRNYVSILEDGTPVTLLTWLKGKTADTDDLSEDFCKQYGQLVAQLHKASADFDSDKLLSYDDQLCDVLSVYINILQSK